jgi:hypothetical protein
MTALLTATAVALLLQTPHDAPPLDRFFDVGTSGEAVATIAAGCARCDWGVEGREAVLLEIFLDGQYSQHLALTRGETVADYSIVLGALAPGRHHLEAKRDAVRSAAGAGAVTFGRVDVHVFDRQSAEYAWLSRAPILRARPGTVEKFSDFPLIMYAEQHINGESGSKYSLQYTVIFTNEDGGTPTDRLMATWGRTTDIEFIYGLTDPGGREEIQAEGHKWILFNGPRVGTHPVVWVATLNNMVADHGPEDMIRFAPAPQLVSLDHASREKVMDDNPWMYAVTSGEMVREHRVDANAKPGSGTIVDPRRYATVEACGQVKDATLAFDIGFRDASGTFQWIGTDTDPRFRITRGGCFRGGAPLPAGTTIDQVKEIRVRAYARPPREGEILPPGSGSVVMSDLTRVFMLDEHFVPRVSPLLHLTGKSIPVTTDGRPAVLMVIVDHAGTFDSPRRSRVISSDRWPN